MRGVRAWVVRCARPRATTEAGLCGHQPSSLLTECPKQAITISRHWLLVGSAIGAILCVFDGFAIENNGAPWIVQVKFKLGTGCGLQAEPNVPLIDSSCDVRRACFCNTTGQHLWPRLSRPAELADCPDLDGGVLGEMVCVEL